MPKSFLVKNKKSFYSPVPVKGHSLSPSKENGVSSPQRLVQSSHSAFESFSGRETLKVEKRDSQRNVEMTTYVSPFGFSSSFSDSCYQDDLRHLFVSNFKTKTEDKDFVYADLRREHCRQTLKENIQEKLEDQTQNFPVVKGPLPQSTFICQLCKQVYSDAFSLAQHKCSGIKHVEHRCPECNKVFSCPANLASHRRWHRPRSPTSNKPLKLPKLKDTKDTPTKRRTSPPTDVSREISDQQESNEDSCGESEPAEVKIDEMELCQDENNNSDETGSENGNGEFACEQCGKTFRRQAYLRKHVNYHANNRPYPCQYCGKVFRSLTNRAKHVLNHAVGPKGHTCEICGNRFPNRATLEKHSRIHNGEIFSCPQCSSTFYSSPGLQRHILKCHSQSEEANPNVLVPAR